MQDIWIAKDKQYDTWRKVVEGSGVSYDQFLEKWDGEGSVSEAAEEMGYSKLDAAKIEAEWSRRGQAMLHDSDKWQALQAILQEYSSNGRIVAANQCEKEASTRSAAFRAQHGTRTILTIVDPKSHPQGTFPAVASPTPPGRYVLSLYEVALGRVGTDPATCDTIYNPEQGTYTVNDRSRYIERYKCMIQVDRPEEEDISRNDIRELTQAAIAACEQVSSLRAKYDDLITSLQEPPHPAPVAVDTAPLRATFDSHLASEIARLESLTTEPISVTVLKLQKRAFDSPYSIVWAPVDDP
eukprot:TRINITY_DN7455_c1_g2_i1.p1 TRINITY_DN7455_c1_g2~~TRINITY_DN7455_c1_g2_i1.p1  ORF type:complete len:297 (+),score=83.28 TRINITY_DN7455_c1_g2_i1:714-1604(+)